MAVTATWYTHGLEAVMKGEVDLLTDASKVALLASGYTPDQSHKSWLDVETHEASGAGYTAGGATLENKRVIVDVSDRRATFDADDVTWTNSEITARYAAIYDDTASEKPLLALIDFGEEMSSSNGPFTIQWDSSGILRFTAA